MWSYVGVGGNIAIGDDLFGLIGPFDGVAHGLKFIKNIKNSKISCSLT